MQDAALVPDEFVFQIQYHNTQQSHYNRIYFAGANQPYRAVTVWNTVYEQYYEDTSDPRTPWGLMDGLSVSVVPKERAGMATGIFSTTRVAGEGIALAIVGAVLVATAVPRTSPSGTASRMVPIAMA